MTYSESFNNWAKRVKWATKRLRSGVASGWKLYDSPEISRVKNIKAVGVETRPGILGSSLVGSRTIKLNPTLLKNNAMMWATTLIHETEHALGKASEEEPTRAEFKLLGRIYKKAVSIKSSLWAREAIRGGMIAMKQRKRMVNKDRLSNDRQLLLKSGFSEKATQLIMEV